MIVSLKVLKTLFDVPKLKRKARSAKIRALYQAAGYLRLVARRSLKEKPGPASAGAPPHTHTLRLPNAIVFAVDETWGTAVIGPAYNIIRNVGGAHEFGGMFRGQSYPARPYMRPALDKTRTKIAAKWANSIR